MKRVESAVVLAAVVAVSIGMWLLRTPPAEVEAAEFVPAPSTSVPAMVTVHVSGAVNRPGVVRLPDGSRVVDAIEAAGGATPWAALGALNLAAPVSDGSQVVVPRPDTPDGAGAAAPHDDLVAVNTAPAVELERLPGVGPVLAARIVAYREEHGPFATAEDLLDVPGIGESTLADLRPHIRVP